MRYLLQRPLPDELLGSVWIRAARRAGLSIRAVTQVLTNGRKWAPGLFTAGHLPDLAAWLDVPPHDLLWQHTVFPYATAFHAREVFESALTTAVSVGVAAIGMGAVTQSASDQVRLRRYCSRCAREDRATWGESYWHRAHNLPGVLVCLKHGNALIQTQTSTGGAKYWSYELPHELPGRRVLQRRPSDFEVELACRSIALLSRPLQAHHERNPDWYREALLERGLLTPDRQVSADRLAAWLLGQVGGNPGRFGFTKKEAAFTWPALMVRPRAGIPFIPLKHLIFETALALQPRTAVAVVDHVPSGPSGRPKDAMDKQYAAALRAVVRAYVQRGERVRVQSALAEAGCWQAYRHNRQHLPRTAAAVIHLRLSAASYRPKFKPE